MSEGSDNKTTKERKFWSTVEIDRIIEEEAKKQTANGSYKSDSDIIRSKLLGTRDKEENDFRKDAGRLILARYPGTCLNEENCIRPDGKFKAGEWIFWVEHGRYMCIDCYDQLAEHGDTDKERRVMLRIRKLERIRKHAEHDADLALMENELDALPKEWCVILTSTKENERKKGEFLAKYIDIPEASKNQVTRFLNDQARQYVEIDRALKDLHDILLPRIMRKKAQKKTQENIPVETVTQESEENNGEQQTT